MNQPWTTTSVKRHPLNGGQLSSRLRMTATLLALPIGLLSLLPKSAFATEPMLRLNVKHSTVMVAQPDGPRSHHGREQAAAQREVIRYEEARRVAQRKRSHPAWGNGAQQEMMI